MQAFKCGKTFSVFKHQKSVMVIRRHVQTVGAAMEKWKTIFLQEKVSEPTSSIKNIMSKTLQLKNLEKLNGLKEKDLTEIEQNEFQDMCSERLIGKPVQYIIGEWDFGNLTLDMKSPIFIPRPETEELAAIAKDIILKLNKHHVQVLDIGCGTGCISLDILNSCQTVYCTAIDKNLSACDLTEWNAKKLLLKDRLEIVPAKIENGNICGLEEKKFDVIISNPPYIPSRDIGFLQDEIIRFEDRAALDGGRDGLDIVRDIIQYANCSLNSNGCLIMEVGLGQPAIIEKYVAENSDFDIKSFKCTILKDFTYRDRFVQLSKEL